MKVTAKGDLKPMPIENVRFGQIVRYEESLWLLASGHGINAKITKFTHILLVNVEGSCVLVKWGTTVYVPEQIIVEKNNVYNPE